MCRLVWCGVAWCGVVCVNKYVYAYVNSNSMSTRSCMRKHTQTTVWLFLTSVDPIEVAHGATIKLGEKISWSGHTRQWATRQLDGGVLELSMVTSSDEGREKVAQRMESVAHEVASRKADLEALKAKQLALTTAMEEVHTCAGFRT